MWTGVPTEIGTTFPNLPPKWRVEHPSSAVSYSSIDVAINEARSEARGLDIDLHSELFRSDGSISGRLNGQRTAAFKALLHQ